MSTAEQIVGFLRRNFIASVIFFIVIVVPLTGIFDAVSYYHYFDIRIIDYLSFVESTLLFLDKIIDNVIPMLGWALFEVYIFNHYIKHPQIRLEIVKYRYLISIGFFLLVFALSLYKVYMYSSISGHMVLVDERGHFYFLLSSLIFYVGWFCIYLVYLCLYRSPVLFFAGRVFPLVMVFFASTVFKNRGVTQAIWNFPDEQDQITLVMDDNTNIKTGRDTVYLGRTASSIFFLIRNDTTKLIINSDKVKMIHGQAREKSFHHGFFFSALNDSSGGKF